MGPTTSNTADIRPRELAFRRGDGIEVTLTWDPVEDAIGVTVRDTVTGERLMIPVPRDEALVAFRHPYAYAAPRLRVTVGSGTGAGYPRLDTWRRGRPSE